MTINDRPPAAPQKKLGAHGYQFPTPKAPQAPPELGAKAMPGAPIPPERRPVAPPVAAPPSPAPAVETAEQVEAPAERIATGYDAARGVYTYDDDPPAPPAPARQTAPEPVQSPATPATPIAPPAETEAATAPLVLSLDGIPIAETQDDDAEQVITSNERSSQKIAREKKKAERASGATGKSSSVPSSAAGGSPPPREDGTTGAGKGEEPPPSSRPVIELRADVHEVEAEAVAALAGCDIYQKTPVGLVRVIDAPPLPDDASPTARACAPEEGSPILDAVSLPALRTMLSAAAEFRRYDARSKEWRHVAPPNDLLAGVAAAKVYPPRIVRILRGVIEAPTLRPDGSVLSAPGYDARTGLLLKWNGPPVEVPERPTLADAKRAHEHLSRLFADFTFQGDATEQGVALSGMLSAILTPVARACINGPVPAIYWTANKPNGGKSLAAKVCGVIVTGRVPDSRPYPAADEEMAKILTELAINSPAVGFFDNIKVHVGGGAIEGALTAHEAFSPRILGVNKSPSLPWRTTLYLTGNDANVSSDNTGRLVFVQLVGRGRGRIQTDDGGKPRKAYDFPEIIEHARSNRSAYLSDALTILRAHHVAGGAQVGRVRDTFEAWSRRVASALAWCSGYSPADAFPPDGADVDTAAAQDVVIAWHEAFGVTGPNGAMTAAELRDRILHVDTTKPGADGAPKVRAMVRLRSALAELCGVPDLSKASPRSIGKHLAGKVCGNVFAAPWRGTVQLGAEPNHNKVMEYSLAVTAAARPDDAGAGFGGLPGDSHTSEDQNCQSEAVEESEPGEEEEPGESDSFGSEGADDPPPNPQTPDDDPDGDAWEIGRE